MISTFTNCASDSLRCRFLPRPFDFQSRGRGCASLLPRRWELLSVEYGFGASGFKLGHMESPSYDNGFHHNLRQTRGDCPWRDSSLKRVDVSDLFSKAVHTRGEGRLRELYGESGKSSIYGDMVAEIRAGPSQRSARPYNWSPCMLTLYCKEISALWQRRSCLEQCP